VNRTLQEIKQIPSLLKIQKVIQHISLVFCQFVRNQNPSSMTIYAAVQMESHELVRFCSLGDVHKKRVFMNIKRTYM
jgi:hypothetical protein